MEKFNWKKLKPVLIESMLFILMVGLGWFGFVFLRQNIQTKMDHLQGLDVLSENQYREMASLPELESQYQFIRGNEDALNGVILTKDHLVEFIQILEKIAVEKNVEIKIASQDNTLLESKITPSAETKKSSSPASSGDENKPSVQSPKKETGILGTLPLPNRLRLTITVIGTYPDVVSYLHAMETLPFALDVIGVHLSEHVETGDRIPPDTGVNPFTPSPGTPESTPAPAPPPRPLRLDGNFDTVVYLKK